MARRRKNPNTDLNNCLYYGGLSVGVLAIGYIALRAWRGGGNATGQSGMGGVMTLPAPQPQLPPQMPQQPFVYQGQSMGVDRNGIPIIAMPRTAGQAAIASGAQRPVNLGQRTGGLAPQQLQQAARAQQASVHAQQQAMARSAQITQAQQAQQAQQQAMNGAQGNSAQENYRESFGGAEAGGFGGESF